MRAEDKLHIKAKDTRCLSGSVDIDTALLEKEPNANRWDYVISYKQPKNKEFLYWVETHTGSDKEIKVVLKKLEWLKNWLNNDGSKLAKFERKFIWVASGKTSFTNGSTQVKILAEKGLQYLSMLHIS